MPKDLTFSSAAEYDHILYGQMTPAMAAAYLRDGKIALRSFSETLREMAPVPDLLGCLTDFFTALSPEANPLSVRRKIRNWLSGKYQPSSREDLFCIAFALGLSEQQLNHLLCLCTDYGIQYRNGWELVFTWFLRSGRSYQQARAFYDTLPQAPGLERVEGREASRLTQEVYSDFLMVQTEEELRACYCRNLSRFGSLHLRAYYYFDLYLGLLIRPSTPWAAKEEPDYSLEMVMDTYLSVHIPRGRKRDNYSLIQRLVKQNWPNATSVKNIRLHKEDVPRKLLLLLYVVTENVGVQSGPYAEEDEEPTTLEERMEDHWWTLNALLADCGMAPLDPRNATDWLILYAICADPDQAMSERLEQVLSFVFADIESE